MVFFLSLCRFASSRYQAYNGRDLSTFSDLFRLNLSTAEPNCADWSALILVGSAEMCKVSFCRRFECTSHHRLVATKVSHLLRGFWNPWSGAAQFTSGGDVAGVSDLVSDPSICTNAGFRVLLNHIYYLSSQNLFGIEF